jgi:FixJ family two-component response regulator
MIVRTYAASDQLLKSIAQKCPDCLLLDLQLPGSSGLEILKYLQQRHIRIPTIIITGSGETGSRSVCLKAGAVAYLTKPLDADQVIQTIRTVCGTSARETFPPIA